MANDDQDLELDVDGENQGGGSKKMIIIIAAVVLIGGGAAAFFLLGGDSEEAATDEAATEEVVEPQEAIYVGVPNAITANLPGAKRSRTIQIKLNFLVRSSAAKDLVKQHMPQLKNDILMLVSQKKADDLKLPEGRIKLQQEALETVQKTLKDITGESTIEKVLFVSFVMQ
ncbi:MAG: flagellar basal body-associated FliL family protein [Enterobacterales bacterium]|nr:flagellar basal body-associated FliL family protein [Enterobacterales bacterium]